jgi:uncharacterized protein YecE (DUF72 family)
MVSAERRIGTAGWALPPDVRDQFGTDGTQLERYARRFNCVEINSSFYRPHRASTYERWARSVPDDFRFALKVPKEITHVRRLVDVDDELERFIEASAALGHKRDVLLVQLPPSFAYDATVVMEFLTRLRARYGGRVACEPRHASWFTGSADDALAPLHVARVAADPQTAGAPFAPGGWTGFAYWRLHGTPRVYYSAYEDARLDAIAAAIDSAPLPAWCIFDNTAFGAATANALTMCRLATE